MNIILLLQKSQLHYSYKGSYIVSSQVPFLETTPALCTTSSFVYQTHTVSFLYCIALTSSPCFQFITFLGSFESGP